MPQQKKILIIGGTGAQGIPIVHTLSSLPKSPYSLLILTRDVHSPRAKSLASLPNVSLISGSFASEPTLRSAFAGCWGAFVNLDGFNTGEKGEIFWGIRTYELALEAGVKVFVWGNLDYAYKKSGYKPEYRTGHYDGKGRVGEWILQQNIENGIKKGSGRMSASLFTTGPYIEMAVGKGTPMSPVVAEDGAVEWRVPLGTGAVVHVSLEDCGAYVKWLFENGEEADGLDLEVAIEHVHYDDLAKAWERVTGTKARFVDVSLEEYWEKGPMSAAKNMKAGYNADPNDRAALSIEENFTGFWNIWKASGGNTGLIQRDYRRLGEILPGRIKSVEEWLRREDEKGRKEGKGGLYERVLPENLRPVLKIAEDRRRGKL